MSAPLACRIFSSRRRHGAYDFPVRISIFNRPVSVALLLLAVTALPLAQERSGPPRSEGEPVMIQLHARMEEGGAPVTDLSVADIVVKVAGKVRTVTRLQLFHFGEARQEPIIPAPFSTNVQLPSGTHDTILVIDDESIVPGDERRLWPAVEQYMTGLIPSARVAIKTVMERGLTVQLTRDRDAIRKALRSMIGRATGVQTSADAPCRTRRIFDAISTLATAYPPGEPPASVLLFTTGLTAPTSSVQLSRVGNVGSGAPSAICEVEGRNYQNLQRTLLESSMDLHVIEAALAPSQPMRAGLEMLAGVSGNAVTELVGSPEGAMFGLANAVRSTYLATFVPEPRERNDNVQRVEVSSKRRGVQTIARSQVLLTRPTPSSQPQVPSAMLKGATVYRDLELRAAAYFSQDASAREKLAVVVLFEPDEDGVKTTAASIALYDSAGTLRVQGTADAGALAKSPGMIAVAATPGRYRLRLAAVDESGRAGTLDETIEVGLTAAGPLQLGSLVPGVRDGQFVGRLMFGAADTAMAYVPVYGAPAGTPLDAVMEITDSKGAKLGVAPTQILDAPDGSRVIVSGLRLASVPAGDYQMKVIVALDGKVVGQTARSFRRR